MEDRIKFPELPEGAGLRDLTDEQVNELLEKSVAVARKFAERGRGEFASITEKAEFLNEYEAGAEAIKALKEEREIRKATGEDFLAKLNDLDGKTGIPEPSAEEKATPEVVAEAEKVEPIVEEVAVVEAVETVAAETPAVEVTNEAELVTASAEKPALPTPEPIFVIREESPVQAMVASGGIEGIMQGSKLDRLGLAEAVMRAQSANIALPKGFREDSIVASADLKSVYPEDRRLSAIDPYGNLAKIRAVVAQEAMGIDPNTGEPALLASGGLCAPVTPVYSLWNEATAARPVRDSLVGFNADRGGVNVAVVPTIEDVTTAVGIKTAAQDAAGGTNATKTCQVVDCPDFEETLLSMIYHCVQFGNLNARAWPEQVAQFNDLVMAAHSRIAEQNLLNGISNASVAVTGSKIYGATSTLIDQLLYIVAAQRSRFRLSLATRFRALFPAWVRELIAADVVNTQFERFGVAPGDVEGLLRRYGVEVAWYLDTATGEGQIFSPQTAGTLFDFPPEVVYYVYPEGSFLFLDGGVLELGIVRDSTLNSTNDFQIFGESFENVAYVGPVSYAVTTAICNDGTVANPATAITCNPSN